MAQCAILSLGSNIEPRFDYVSQAVAHLRTIPNSRVLQISPVYETEPVLTPAPDQDTYFLNCVVVIETELDPSALLHETQAIEARLHRERSIYGAPRTIDIDLISVGSYQLTQGAVILPHPRAHLRRFVLQPLADVLPDFVLPGFAETVKTLLKNTQDRSLVRRFAREIDAT